MTVASAPKRRDKKLCGAKKRQSAGECTRPAGWGTQHVGFGRCKLHGGSTPTQAKSVEVQRADELARDQFGKLTTIRPVDNPLEVYRVFAGRVMAWLETLDSMVDDLTSMRYEGMSGEQIRGEVLVFERAMDRANTVLATYARLNIDERLAGVTIEQKKMIIRAIEAALASAGVAGPAAVEAKRVAARHLRVVGPDEGAAA